jgi:hypothetical protein
MFNRTFEGINGGFIGNIAGMQENMFSTPLNFGQETFIAQGKKPSGKIGSIPPESTTVTHGGFIPFGIGGQKVPYATQERGLFRANPYAGESGFAAPGVVLGGGRRGQNPGIPVRGEGVNATGMNAVEEQFYRSPGQFLEGGIGNIQLQLRKLGVPGF